MSAGNDAGGRGGEERGEDRDIDTGRPIEGLSLVRYEPAPGLIRLVRGSIRRRLLGREMADLLWSAPRAVFVEFLKLLFRPFVRDNTRNGGPGHD